jgi:hypothetical protein
MCMVVMTKRQMLCDPPSPLWFLHTKLFQSFDPENNLAMYLRLVDPYLGWKGGGGMDQIMKISQLEPQNLLEGKSHRFNCLGASRRPDRGQGRR